MSADARTRPAAPAWFTATICGLFGLFYAYAVWAGVAYLITITEFAGVLGASVTPLGWIALILSIVVPIGVFIVAVLIGLRRAAWKLALALFVGLAVVAVFWQNVQSLSVNVTNFFA